MAVSAEPRTREPWAKGFPRSLGIGIGEPRCALRPSRSLTHRRF